MRLRQRPRDDETERAKQAEKKLEYCNDLQRMINDQNQQKRSIKANTIQSEREVSKKKLAPIGQKIKQHYRGVNGWQLQKGFCLVIMG